MLLEQKIKIKWSGKSIKYYESMGYVFTKKGDTIDVDIAHLSQNSNIEIYYICDYCGKKDTRKFSDYNKYREKSVIDKDACNDCKHIKEKETFLFKYGVTNPSQLDEVKQKKKNTCVLHFGKESHMQNKEFMESFKQKNIDKYGVPFPLSLPQTQQKIEETNFKKHGYKRFFERRDEIEKICLERYGVRVPLQNKEINAKARKTLYENGTAPTSFQQLYLHNLLGGKLNYPIGGCSADILLENNIIIEYAGGGHYLTLIHGELTEEEFKQKEIKRNKFLKSQGYKIIEIISKQDKLPTDNKIKEMIELAKDYLLSSNHSWFCFDIDNKLIKCAEYTTEFNYGQLKEIKKSKSA